MEKSRGPLPELPNDDTWAKLPALQRRGPQMEPMPYEDYRAQFREAVAFHEQTFSLRSKQDRYEAAFYRAFGRLLEDDSFLADELDDTRTAVVNNDYKHPFEAAFSFNKVFQLFRSKEDTAFPAGMDSADAWAPHIRRLAGAPSFPDDLMRYFRLPIMSNVSERGKLLKASLLLNERDSAEGLEIGCSLKHIFKRLALLNELGPRGRNSMNYEPIQVLPSGPGLKANIKPDKTRSARLNNLVQKTAFKLGHSACLDIFDVDRDIEINRWASSNSFYMGEILEYRRRMLFDALMTLDPRDVALDFMYRNAANWDPTKLGRKVDFAYISTMLYQLQDNPAEVQAVLQHAEQTLKPDGLLIVQDFVDIDEQEQLHFDRRRGNWSYKVWVKDMSKPERGYQLYFTSETGRAKQVILGPALGQLATARALDLAPAA